MTAAGDRRDERPDGGAVHQLLLDWRTRCASRAAPWELAADRAASALCAAVVRTLEDGALSPELPAAVRQWGTRVSSPADARAALQCLGEAVAALVGTEFGRFRPKGLDPVLEQLARESVIPAGHRMIPLDLGPLDHCLPAGALTTDLGRAVIRATAGGEDVTVVVLSPEDDGPAGAGDGPLELLLGAVRQAFGQVPVYRVRARALALVAPGLTPAAAGERILRATCTAAVRFSWGRASLRAAGAAAATSPDLLLALAEAELRLRRQELSKARRGIVRTRHLSAVGSVAAGLLLVAGASVGLTGGGAAPGATHVALPARPGPASVTPVTPVTPAPSGPAHSPAPPAASPGALPTTVPAATPAANVVLTSFRAPQPAPASAPASPAPTSSPPPPAPAPTPTTTVPPHGHSGGAPGHTKGAGRPGKRA